MSTIEKYSSLPLDWNGLLLHRLLRNSADKFTGGTRNRANAAVDKGKKSSP
ncbi:MAG: hypothetical protein M3Z24_05290 [Chloroflexota bacterium]|nr:hypothetical protein [Chloroflexota bacterium]